MRAIAASRSNLLPVAELRSLFFQSAGLPFRPNDGERSHFFENRTGNFDTDALDTDFNGWGSGEPNQGPTAPIHLYSVGCAPPTS